MRYFWYLVILSSLLVGVFFLLQTKTQFEIKPLLEEKALPILSIPEGEKPAEAIVAPKINKITDLPNQKPLANPPSEIKAVYATSWSAGSVKRMDYLINLIKTTELNALVIDIKDFSGTVTYDTKIPEVEKYGAEEIRIPRLNALLKRLHDENIYVIARITVFQDPILTKARPDLAVKDKTTGEVWKDGKGLSWVDPASTEAWDYIISISKDAVSRGFDELNFDYIRFPSDGDIETLDFPIYSPDTALKATVIKDFFSYLRSHLQGVRISANLFGIATIATNDLGIGQVIENAYLSFDYVSPMVYPSHYSRGSFGYKNPAQFPYEVVKYSMDQALLRLKAMQPLPTVRLRPWLQDFDLGADYDALKVRAEIRAVEEALLAHGWMLWDPNNVYTQEALLSVSE